MRYFKRFGQFVAVSGSSIAAAHADIVTDATTAITAAGASGLTVGGGVVAAVAGLAVVGIILALVRKV